MHRLIVIIFFFIGFLNNGIAQDNHFTQFFASPLTLNPALSGNYNGNYRFSTIYRNQWFSSLTNPYKAYAATFDLKYRIGNNKRNQDYLGFGLMFYHDNIGLIEYSTNSININLAFHKKLDDNYKQYLSGGFQIGISQKNIDFNSLLFEDQFNLTYAYSNPTNEFFNNNNYSFWDFGAGINYSLSPSQKSHIDIGASFYHIATPNISFNKKDAEPKFDLLKRKYIAYASFRIPLNSSGNISLLPRFYAAFQNPHLEINTGTNVRIVVSEYKKLAVHMGSWVRPVLDADKVASLEAIVFLVGIEFKDILLGISYDYNISKFQSNSINNAFEISIGYLGDYINDDNSCPKF